MAYGTPQRQAQLQPQNLPKALRIGVIQGGKIVEERLVRRHQDITVGQSNKNTFVVPSPSMPRSYTLFEVHGDRYLLNFTDQMDGRVAVGEQPVPLAQLRDGQRAVRRGNGWALGLPDKSRGKVSMGDVTFLFQFVTAPPVAARPQLPPSMRGSFLDRIDVVLTCILGASFLLHLVVLGVLSAIHLPDRPDPSVVPDYVTDVIVPHKEEKPKVADNTTTGQSEKKAETKHASHESKSSSAANKGPVDPVAEAKAQAARVAAQTAAARSYGVVGAFGAVSDDPNAVASSVGSGDVDLNRVVKSVGGVSSGGPGIGGALGSKVSNGQNSVASIGNLSAAGPNSVNATGARSQDTSDVAAHVSTGHAEVDSSTSGSLTQNVIDSQIRHLIGAVQACYSRQLKSNPGMKHVKITVDFTIGTHGTVTDASVSDDEGGNTELEGCITSVIHSNARFSPPPPQPTDVSYPFILSGN